MITRREFVGTASTALVGLTTQPLLGRDSSLNEPAAPAAQTSPTTARAHDYLEAFCGNDSLGCAIDLGLLSDLLRNQLDSTTDRFSFPTSFPGITVGLSLQDVATLRFVADQGKLFLRGFRPSVILYAGTTKLGSLTFAFEDAELTLPLSNNLNGVLPFELANRPKFPVPPFVPTSAPTAVAADIQRAADAIILAAPYAILEEFVGTLPLPSALSAMRGFIIEVAQSLRIVDQWLLIKGPASFVSHDICEQLGINYSSTQSAVSPGPGAHEFNVSSSDIASPGPPELQHSAQNVKVAFYYPAGISWKPLADATVRPAIAPEPKNVPIAMFRAYHAVAAIVENAVVELVPADRTIKIKAPMSVTGGAGFALKVACVYQPFVHFGVSGRIDPNDFTVKFDVRRTATGIGLVGACSYKPTIRIGFSGLHDVVSDFVLGIILRAIIKHVLKDKLKARQNALNFKLLQFDGLFPLKADQQWGTDQSWRAGSTVFGVEAANYSG